MGKALLIMVMGAGLYISIGQMGTQETLIATAADQAGYEEEVLAREVAKSGFNMAMAIARMHGSNLQEAIQEINGDDGAMTGEHQGGMYSVRAWLGDGFSITIKSTGTFADAEHTMDDSYRVPVLLAQRCSQLDVRFLESAAGYCSAIYLQRHPAGTEADEIPLPEMIFSAGHYADNVGVEVDKVIAQGTQMDFFIGVDEDCSTRIPDDQGGPRAYDVDSHVYNASDYDHDHHSLDVPLGSPEQMTESIWGFVEQHPDSTQMWRIGWEDQHITLWDNPMSTDPANSLQALKHYGYDGDGWSTRDALGYRALRDYGSRPDFSDQVIELWLIPIDPATEPDICTVSIEGSSLSGEDPDPYPDPDPECDSSGSGNDCDDPDPYPETPGCMCPGNGNQNRKIAIMHRPPGNESNEHVICVSISGWERGHRNRHNDYVVCEGV